MTPLEQFEQDTLKEFENTKFAKGGGSSFECSDFEGMYIDMQDFITQKLREQKSLIITEAMKALPEPEKQIAASAYEDDFTGFNRCLEQVKENLVKI